MLRIALESILAKKRRFLSTALSVLLGVAFLSGTFVFTDSMSRTFDDLFAGIYADTDSYVRPAASIEVDMGPSQRGRMPGPVVDTVAAVPGVADAQAVVSGFAQIVDADGDAIGNPAQGAPTFGMSYTSGALTPWQLTEGSKPPGPGEVVVDKGSADKGDLELGDMVTVLTQTGAHELILVGTARFGSIDSPGGASVSVFDLATAQDVLLGGADEIDAVIVDAAPGISEAEITARIAAELPDGLEAITGAEVIEENQDALHEGLSFFNTFLLVFAAIALVVAAFTIYNTFQIIVTQRSREMALLRAIGATRRQVVAAQLLEAAILGVTASVLGLFAGFGVATLLKGLLRGFGIDIPAGGSVLESRTVVVALTVGIVVTLGSAVFPSLRASRVPPLAAIRDLVTPTGEHATRRRLVQGGLLMAAGTAAFAAGLGGGEVWWVGVGAFATFVAAFVLGPLVARPVTRALAVPISRSVTGLIARENAARSPKRTARTGGALMVGVALVAAITIIAATAKDWTRDIFENQFNGDFVVTSDSFGFGGLSPDIAAAVNELEEVDAATGVRLGYAADVERGGSDIAYASIDPATATRVFDLGLVDGEVEGLTGEGILVEDDTARRRGVGVGDTLVFGFLDGSVRTLTVHGLYGDDDLAGQYVVSHVLHESTGADQFDFAVFVATARGVDGSAAAAAIASVVDAYPNAELQSRDEYIEAQAAQVDQLVNLMYGLLGLAIVIALLSIGNSISLSIHERTHELGLLRAVGMTRHQTGSTVRWEAAMVATLGTGLGLLLGVGFGWAISVALRNDGLTAVAVPVGALVVIAAIAVLGGVLAAVRPGWRAAHLDVLRAVASE